MNNVKLLLHIKCCFFQFFNSPVALKNIKKIAPQEKVEMTPLDLTGWPRRFLLLTIGSKNISEIEADFFNFDNVEAA